MISRVMLKLFEITMILNIFTLCSLCIRVYLIQLEREIKLYQIFSYFLELGRPMHKHWYCYPLTNWISTSRVHGDTHSRQKF